MHIARLAVLLAALATALAWAAAERPVVAGKESEITFIARQFNVPVSGRFQRFAGKVMLDPTKPETSSVSMDVDTTSVTFGDEEADTEVVRPIWLDTAQYPKAQFVSTSVKPLGGGRYDVRGTLTVKGISREITAPCEAKDQPDGSTVLAGQFEIKRADFHVGEGDWSAFDVVANEVQVKFRLRVGQPAAPGH